MLHGQTEGQIGSLKLVKLQTRSRKELTDFIKWEREREIGYSVYSIRSNKAFDIIAKPLRKAVWILSPPLSHALRCKYGSDPLLFGHDDPKISGAQIRLQVHCFADVQVGAHR